MEGDPLSQSHAYLERYFNPLPPHGGRLYGGNKLTAYRIISIHSLRMEGDIYEI